MSQLLLTHSVRVIDLVTQDQERGLLQLLHTQQGVQLGLALDESLRVLGVDQEHDAGDFGEVVLPQATGLLVPAEIEGGEAAGADGELFGGGVESGLEDGDAVVLEHVEKGGLACMYRNKAVSTKVALGGYLSVAVLVCYLPALSRPRKRSFACLLARPSWASMSQTTRYQSAHTALLSTASHGQAYTNRGSTLCCIGMLSFA